VELVLRTEDGREIRARVRREGDRFLVELEEGKERRRLDLERAGPSLLAGTRQRETSVRRLAGEGHIYEVSTGAAALRIEVTDPLTALAARSSPEGAAKRGGKVKAYMPGRVVAVLVEPGATVNVGQGMVVLEAMKMQNEIQAERAGTVKAVHVQPGQSVDGGDLMFEME
jgi:biotin carboxyl carrier protein